MAIAGTRARLVTFEPTGPITARNVQDAVVEAAGGGGGGGGTPGLSEVLASSNNAGTLKITELAAGTAPSDAANVGQVAAANSLDAVLDVGADAGGHVITNLSPGTNPTDAANVSQIASAPGLNHVLATLNDADDHKITGLADGTDPQDAATVGQLGGGGGGGVSTSRAIYTGDAVTVADGATGTLTINTKSSGTTLLDLTTPAAAVVLTPGIYAVAVQVDSTVATTDGFYRVTLTMDDDNMAAAAQVYAPPVTAVFGAAVPVLVAMTFYLPADGVFKVQVTNYDGGAGSNDFYITALNIQKVS